MPFSDTNEENDDDSQISAAERCSAAPRSTWVSVAVNVLLSAAQIVVGVLAKLQGLIADGVHPLSDLVADFVVLLAHRASQKDADEDHPHGHQRFETAASLALGAILLAAGADMLWSAAVKLENPGAIASACGGAVRSARHACREGAAVTLRARGSQAREVDMRVAAVR